MPFPTFPHLTTHGIQWGSPQSHQAKVEVIQFTKGGMAQRVNANSYVNPVSQDWEVKIIMEDKAIYDDIKAFLRSRTQPTVEPFYFSGNYGNGATSKLYTCTRHSWEITGDSMWQVSLTLQQVFRFAR